MDSLESTAAALADPMRTRILDLLSRGRQAPCCSPANPDVPAGVCACDIRGAMGGMAPSKLAYHLKQLREAGLVEEARRGKWVYYTLRAAAFARFTELVGARWSGPAAPSGGAAGRGPARTAPVRPPRRRRAGSPPSAGR